MARAVAVLLAVAVCGGAVNWHTGWDDPGCDPMPVLHNAAAHRFTADHRPSPAPPEHCVLCHLVRLLNTALSGRTVTFGGACAVEARWPADRVLTAALFAFNVPSRAPPAARLLV